MFGIIKPPHALRGLIFNVFRPAVAAAVLPSAALRPCARRSPDFPKSPITAGPRTTHQQLNSRKQVTSSAWNLKSRGS